MKINHVLVDYENVAVPSLDRLKSEHFRVTVFLGPNNTRLPREFALSMHGLGERANYVTLETAGRNALDFHLAFHLGRLAEADGTVFFHIISGDAGFDPLIRHLKHLGILSARSESIDAMPCFQKVAVVQPSISEATIPASPAERLQIAVSFAVTNLLKYGNNKPGKRTALLNALRGPMTSKMPGIDPDQVVERLLVLKFISQKDGKFSYNLPSAK